MPDVTLLIDGVSVTVPAGTNIVDAARRVETAIPVFCYHPRLNPAGMCRMCLVEVGTPQIDRATGQPVLDADGKPVIAMMPKLQTACTTPVSAGMVVKTVTQPVKDAQKGVLEFLLTSHPLDCPVCDKGGECPLQNLTMGWGPAQSRYEYNDKVHFEKPVKLGELIYLDRERCILCSRCVRFQDELADDPVLGFDNRGRNWMIISKSEPGFDSKFSGNTTDICPVGALTSADFRFKARVWELQSKPAVCTLCPVGCNISLDMRHNQLMRVMPRENSAVNDIWICDKGRFGHRFFDHENRLTTPLIRRDGKLTAATWDEALQLVAERLAAIAGRHGGAAIGGIMGDRLANEDLYTFQKLLREQLGSPNVDHRVGAPSEPDDDDLGALLGVGAGTDLNTLGKGAAVLVVGADPEEEAPIYMLRLRKIAQSGGYLAVAGLRPTKLERSASATLRYLPGREYDFALGLARAVYDLVGAERMPIKIEGFEAWRNLLRSATLEQRAAAVGLAPEAIAAAAKALVEAEHGILVYGAETLNAGAAVSEALAVALALAGKVGRTNSGIIALLPRGNSRGALDMGVRPDRGPGYAPLAKPGLGAAAMWRAALDGNLKAMIVAGLDPASRWEHAREALERMEFVVTLDLFVSETAQHADVVLPAASMAARDATYTNAERRVQRSRQARPPLAEARPDWQILGEIGRRVAELTLEASATTTTQKVAKVGGKASSTVLAVAAPAAWNATTPAEIAAEIAERVPGYRGISYNALAATGKPGTWGRQVNEAVFYDGTNYENIEGIGIQPLAACEAPRFSLRLAPREAAAPEAGALLLIPYVVAYDSDPLLRGSKLESRLVQPTAALSSADAARLGVQSGETVRIVSALGSLELPARVASDLPEGVVAVPQNTAGAPLVQVLTAPRTAVRIEKL